jgi:hypothetical protein
MRRHKIISQPVSLNDLGFEDLFEAVYDKTRHDWQKTPARPHLRGWKSHTHKAHRV